MPGRKLGPWSEFPFLYRFTVLLNSGGSNSLWSEFWSEFPHFMGMGVVPASSTPKDVGATMYVSRTVPFSFGNVRCKISLALL